MLNREMIATVHDVYTGIAYAIFEVEGFTVAGETSCHAIYLPIERRRWYSMLCGVMSHLVLPPPVSLEFCLLTIPGNGWLCCKRVVP